jgi:hypothetical protein
MFLGDADASRDRGDWRDAGSHLPNRTEAVIV